MIRKSIRAKLGIVFALLMVLVVTVSFLLVRMASDSVLQRTMRDYLISTVEENVNKIRFSEEKPEKDSVDYSLPYKNGYLLIDTDFLDVVNDVRTALYAKDGTLLYGENPLAAMPDPPPFEASRLTSLSYNDINYTFYDRKLLLDLSNGDELFIRGIVSDENSTAQLSDITRLSLALLPVLILLALLLVYLVTGRLLSPLVHIEETAAKIAEDNDLHARIEGRQSKDEIGRLAQTFNRMLERLENAFKKEQQFTSDVSHELRTPTSVILTQAEIALEGDQSNEDYKDALRVIKRQGDRMNSLIEDMLASTRMDQVDSPELRLLDLSSLVLSVTENLPLLAKKNIALHTEVASDLYVKGDKSLLLRLVQNLLDNACRYGKENGTITLGLKKQDDGILLSVKDDGIGIAREDQEKIFDRFYRSDTARSQKGSGLGLSMVKKIAELHGATLGLTSELGKGSCFTVLFPDPS